MLTGGFYDAPTVLIIFDPKDFIYAIANCRVMAENMMLTACNLEIGSCLIARAEAIFASEFRL